MLSVIHVCSRQSVHCVSPVHTSSIRHARDIVTSSATNDSHIACKHSGKSLTCSHIDWWGFVFATLTSAFQSMFDFAIPWCACYTVPRNYKFIFVRCDGVFFFSASYSSHTTWLHTACQGQRSTLRTSTVCGYVRHSHITRSHVAMFAISMNERFSLHHLIIQTLYY